VRAHRPWLALRSVEEEVAHARRADVCAVGGARRPRRGDAVRARARCRRGGHRRGAARRVVLHDDVALLPEVRSARQTTMRVAVRAVADRAQAIRVVRPLDDLRIAHGAVPAALRGGGQATGRNEGQVRNRQFQVEVLTGRVMHVVGGLDLAPGLALLIAGVCRRPTPRRRCRCR